MPIKSVSLLLPLAKESQLMERNQRLETTQPEDWIKAFRKESAAKNLTVSEWLGLAGLAKLPASVRGKLSKRRKRGRESGRRS